MLDIPLHFRERVRSKTSWAKNLSPYAYRLEPILNLKSLEFIGAEVLRHGAPFPILSFWHGWYSRMGELQANCPQNGLLFVNLHTHQICDQVLLERFISNLREPRRVVVEWTEFYAAQEALEPAAMALNEIREKHGVLVSVDDFGSGVDGLQRLSLVNPDVVKIDGSLLRHARRHEPARTLLRNIVHLVKDTGAKAVIEWIETDHDLQLARESGADWGQGYFWPYAKGSL